MSVSLRLPPELNQRLSLLAEQTGRSNQERSTQRCV